MSTPIKLNYQPRSFFQPFHHRTERFAIIVAHRRCGKTVSSIHDLVTHILTCPLKNPRGSYVAPTFTQAKDISWVYFKEACISIPGVQFRESDLVIKFPNGGQIRLYGAEKADRMRGIYNDACVIDEVADMAPEVWTEIIRPTLADRGGWVTFIGTPKGRDIFYDIWRLAQKSDQWYTLELPVTETDALTPDEVQNARDTMDENAFQREFMCRFDVGTSDQLITIGNVNTAQSRDNEGRRGQGPFLVGVDVARSQSGDRTVLLYRDGVTKPIYQVFHEDDLMRTATRVAQFEHHVMVNYGQRVQRTFVDAAGVGGGVVDRLRQMGLTHAVDVNGGRDATDKVRFANLKSEMWWLMREWIRERGELPEDREFEDDLTGLEYKFAGRDRIQVETKRELKSRGLPSPDIADALALTFAEPVMTRDYSAIGGVGTFQAAEVATGFEGWEDDFGVSYH